MVELSFQVDEKKEVRLSCNIPVCKSKKQKTEAAGQLLAILFNLLNPNLINNLTPLLIQYGTNNNNLDIISTVLEILHNPPINSNPHEAAVPSNEFFHYHAHLQQTEEGEI